MTAARQAREAEQAAGRRALRQAGRGRSARPGHRRRASPRPKRHLEAGPSGAWGGVDGGRAGRKRPRPGRPAGRRAGPVPAADGGGSAKNWPSGARAWSGRCRTWKRNWPKRGPRRSPCGGRPASGRPPCRRCPRRSPRLTRQAERRRAESLALARQQASREADAARAGARVAELEAGLPALREEAARAEAGAGDLQAGSGGGAGGRRRGKARRWPQPETALTDALGKARRRAAGSRRRRRRRVNAAQSATVALSTRLRTLQELEAAQEGYFAGVKAVFEAKKHGGAARRIHRRRRLVPDARRATKWRLRPPWPRAFRTSSPTPKTPPKPPLLTCTSNRAGRATFLPLNRMRPGRDTLDMGRAMGLTGVLGAALDIITFRPEVPARPGSPAGPRLCLRDSGRCPARVHGREGLEPGRDADRRDRPADRRADRRAAVRAHGEHLGPQDRDRVGPDRD